MPILALQICLPGIRLSVYLVYFFKISALFRAYTLGMDIAYVNNYIYSLTLFNSLTLLEVAMQTLQDLDSTHVIAICFNIVRQAIREDWIIELSAQQAEDKINALLADRNISDKKLTLSIFSEITANYILS